MPYDRWESEVPLATPEQSTDVGPREEVEKMKQLKLDHDTIKTSDGRSLEGDVLQYLIDPLPVDEFLHEIWEERAYVVNRDDSSYFEDIMTFEDLEVVMMMMTTTMLTLTMTMIVFCYGGDGVMENKMDVLCNAMGDEEFGEILFFKNQLQTHYENAFRAFLDDASVVLNHVDKQWPAINIMCQKLQSRFPHTFCNMYLTPAGSQAVHPHSDDRDVLLIQIWGTKEWLVYGSPQTLPFSDEQVGKSGQRLAEGTIGPVSLSATLKTGDTLYIPRGFVHEAKAQEHGSLHITIAIPTQDFTWSGVMMDAMRQKLREEKYNKWRRCVPLTLLPNGNNDKW
ncbi:hypothetical protein GUITHDRAFT_113900 [Guillardia theta CCMP2712]|uniref:Bifunctional lysine-specific demethylase and histidyl-hydroxylase n=1 Tax=Guillardia theta (strain CCMP2712) TaxID=905079 RepID=L1IUH8_GUITC|nr:hypothetical protein GUITHDRAFT_113900 [Guillardia theta CCMP2712]EKX39906.1 hypothetical protein GUITHDRAFT_113900 [Guillardia theta CCMP2712]|eukprot:XP_005826886.1 hypothetical protein GUITHDRAFT_113900 [Guillardia theta CCMP2712]